METSKRDVMNVCRVCMIETASTMQTLFQEYNRGTPPPPPSFSSSLSSPSNKYLSDMFTACTEIILKPNENWPHLICAECSLKLISAFEFRQQCIASEKEIRMVLLGRESTPTNVVVPPKRIKLETDTTTLSHNHTTPNSRSFEPKIELKAEDCDIDCIPTTNSWHNDDDYDDDGSDYVPEIMETYEDNEIVERKVKKHSTAESSKPYQCKECDQRFKKKRSLSAHMRAHKRERGEEIDLNFDGNNYEFPCPECDQVFDRKRSLSSHLRVHNRGKGRKYNCESCFESFANYSLLKKHIKTHQNSGQVFECDICQGKYKFRSRLIQHMESHHKDEKRVENMFPCTFCDKSKQNENVLK